MIPGQGGVNPAQASPKSFIILAESTMAEDTDATPKHKLSIYSKIELSKGEMLEYYLAADKNIEITDAKRWDKKGEKNFVKGDIYLKDMRIYYNKNRFQYLESKI